MFKKNNVLNLLTLWLTFLTMSVVFAQSELARLKGIAPEEVKFAGFTLNSEQDIAIEAVGTHYRSKRLMTTAAWILNADTRELVWELTDANSKWRSRKLRQYHDSVRLPPGRYEVYYANYPTWHYDSGWNWRDFFFKRRDDDTEDIFPDFYISVTGRGRPNTTQEVIDYQREVKKRAVVALFAERNDLFEKQGFELKKPLDLIVYCVGEARDGTFDYGWIINAETRAQVWRFTDHRSEWAGGAEKNRFIKETISLPSGKYAAFYVSDDSHSPHEWNAPPPYDPAFWGLSVFPAQESEKKDVTLFDYQDFAPRDVIVALTRVRDDEYRSKGFTLKRDMKVRIHAVGEGSRGEMYDYGWITNAKTGQRIWEMRYHDTQDAGGNRKNRMVDEIITLPKGSYVVHYVSDDSHSYRRWNTSPPFDQEMWGITVVAAEEDFNTRDVADFDPEDNPAIIARLVRVRDSENRQTRFSLKKDSKIRIYAIGEGRNGEMFDYAWIEDARTGKAVWEMTYRKTDHAGGAQKNRMVNDTVMLEAGDYILHYQTDDSHSFGDWNASAPHDPANYGVTVFAVEN